MLLATILKCEKTASYTDNSEGTQLKMEKDKIVLKKVSSSV